MEKLAKVDFNLVLKVFGGLVGAAGFFLSVTSNPRLGTFLLGVGTIIASLGMSK